MIVEFKIKVDRFGKTWLASMVSIALRSKLLIGPIAASLHKFAMSAPEYPSVWATTSSTSVSDREFLSLESKFLIIRLLAPPSGRGM